MNSRNRLFLLLAVLFMFSFANVLAYSYSGYSSSLLGTSTSYNSYYSSENIKTLWPSLTDSQSCLNRQDMLLQIAPAGCEPTVVRSDLIAEQTVPVLCQIQALQTNPLVDIKSIRNIAFTGKYPDNVAGVVFHPARAALNTRDTLFGDPVINNVGYVVVLLKKNANESSLPSSVSLNLTARLEYQNGNAFGIGRYEFILPEQTDDEWVLNKDKQSFLKGNYFVKLEEAQPDYAIISIYNGDSKISTTRVEKGSSSSDIYLPGFYCQSALTIDYLGYESAQNGARLEVSDEKGTETFDVYQNSQFLDGKCTVRQVNIAGDESGSVSLSCGSGLINLQKKTLSQFAIDQIVYYKNADGTKVNATIRDFSDGLYLIEIDGNRFNVTSSQIQAINIQISDSGTNLSAEAQSYFDEAIESYEQVANDYPQDTERVKVDGDKQVPVAETALYKGVELARAFGKGETQFRLLNKLVDNYPNSPDISKYRNELKEITNNDLSLSGKTIFVNNRYVTIRVVQFNQPKKQASATFNIVKDATSKSNLINYPEFSLSYGNQDTRLERDNSNLSYIKLNTLTTDGTSDRATLIYKCKNEETEKISGTIISRNNLQTNLNYNNNQVYTPTKINMCGYTYSISVSDINTEKVARIRILPAPERTSSETNLSVSIGIEKRAIKLNPEKTNETINNLNASIDKWNKISENLGNAVTVMKGACLATSAILTVKNFFGGLDGTALARQKAMQDYGWDERCRAAIRDKKPVEGDTSVSSYKNIDECFARNSARIDKTIESIKQGLTSQNNDIKSLVDQYPAGTSTLLGGKRANTDSVAVAFIGGNMEDSLKKLTSTPLVNPNNPNEKIDVQKDILDKLNVANDYGNGSINYEQAKRISLSANLITDSNVDDQTKEQAKATLYKELSQIQTSKADRENTQNLIKNFAGAFKSNVNVPFTNLAADSKSVKGFYYKQTGSDLKNKPSSINDGDKVAPLVSNSNNYIVVLQDAGAGNEKDCYGAKALYKMNADGSYTQITPASTDPTSKVVTQNDQAEFAKALNGFSCFKTTDASSYVHRYTNAEVRYYEIEPYKGIPEVVPIDLSEGWYAGIKQESGLFGNTKSVDASGAVQSFWLCNVGANEKEEFENSGFGDDTCKRFDFYTGQVLSDFPGISDKSKVTSLVNRAVSALKDAQRAYATGVKSVNIAGNNLKVGNPAVLINGANCADFMSAKDCSILFNLCDPVICPNSRCDLGGTFQVQDVIQSGIVGSAVLCLPNFGNPSNGGVVIPVCLSGLKAGIDGYVSILKSHRDCLQTSLDNGQMVGICDQIYSVYMCDFFWKQIAPAFDSLIPKIVEYATGRGQSARGGGEYMTVMFAWENAKKSVEYFTQSYALNSFKAFQSRSAEDIGGEFCKAFASSRAPSAIKSLLEPDSPVQFYASFDSQTYSTATVPATAQYKVFYHIYAGNDAGVYYNVYLRNGPQTSYYAGTGSVPVATGFLAKGQIADQSKDFTAPDGYKELCVRINNEEKCGFKQVTTSFAVNYLKDQLVSDQLSDKTVTTESECISGAGAANGDLNALGLLNTNIQSGAQEALSGNIYERGIIRVCSTDNPAKSTNPSRYIQVGVCGDSKVKCWLDKNSVNNALEAGDSGLRNQTLQELTSATEQIQNLTQQLKDSYLSVQNIQANVTKLINEMNGQTSNNINLNAVNSLIVQIDNTLNDIPNGVATENNSVIILLNSQKAQLIKMKADLKGAVAKTYFNGIVQSTSTVKSVPQSGGGTTPTGTAGGTGNVNAPTINQASYTLCEVSNAELKKNYAYQICEDGVGLPIFIPVALVNGKGTIRYGQGLHYGDIVNNQIILQLPTVYPYNGNNLTINGKNYYPIIHLAKIDSSNKITPA